MYSNTPRPKWWQAYLTLPLLITLFMFDHSIKLSERGHEALQIGILLLVYGLVHVWLKANEAALSDYRQHRGTVIISKANIYRLANTQLENRPMLQLPKSEIKGSLDNTFEMDFIEADFFTVDEVSRELKKE
ncbi:MAG: hypothetical protein U0V02_08210 [Anaerolineales bacterium]